MIVEAHEVSAGGEIETDICVIGAGAAGIAIARALETSRRQIVLLEAGGIDYEPETQALYEGEQTGQLYHDLDITRLRYLGGSTNHWGNQVAPFDPIDFEKRPWVPYSGWPITRAGLDPHYRRASEYLDLGPYDFDRPSAWAYDDPEYRIHEFADPRVVNKLFRRRRRLEVGSFYRDALQRQANLRLILHANVSRIGLSANGAAVETVDATTLDGHGFSVKARDYVLAAGGIENPRLLLASNDVVNVGIGNQNDLVGRFFMDHIGVLTGVIRPARQANLMAYDNHADRFDHWAAICLSEAAQRENETAFYRLKLEHYVVGKATRGFAGLQVLRSRLTGRTGSRGLDQAIADVFLDPEGAATGLVNHLTGADTRTLCRNVVEQVPNPDSRITLGDAVDALGMPRPRLHWQLSDLDRTTLRRGLEIVGGALAASGLGRLQIEPAYIEADWTAPGFAEAHAGPFRGGHHHAGTTRMAATPADGVVDRDGKVFGIANLFVAGSSTFPTVGSANVTFTICALAFRLADHLAGR